jgi:NAD(P)H-flavin reductase
MINIYQPKLVKVVNVTTESIDTHLIRFKFVNTADQRIFAYLPGQFVQIGFVGWGECPISFCSSPVSADKFFELAIRDVGPLTHKLNQLKPGDIALVRGPFGNGFDADKFKNQKLLIIGGGCGFVPLRPLIIDALAGRIKTKKLQIFYGCLNEETLLFKKQFAEWNRKAELGIILDKPMAAWKGEKGLITDLIKKREIASDAVVVMVGPPVMYKFALKELDKKGVKPENIWLSLERRMYCGVGVCQHCAIGPYYVCRDGPVFNYSRIKNIPYTI